MEQMLGSYGPHPQGEPYIKNFDPEESPSGILARSGTYLVKSRVADDDGEVYAGTSVVRRVPSDFVGSPTFLCRVGVGVQACEGVVIA